MESPYTQLYRGSSGAPLNLTLEGHLLSTWPSGHPYYDALYLTSLPPLDQILSGEYPGPSLTLLTNQSAVAGLPASLNQATSALMRLMVAAGAGRGPLWERRGGSSGGSSSVDSTGGGSSGSRGGGGESGRSGSDGLDSGDGGSSDSVESGGSGGRNDGGSSGSGESGGSGGSNDGGSSGSGESGGSGGSDVLSSGGGGSGSVESGGSGGRADGIRSGMGRSVSGTHTTSSTNKADNDSQRNSSSEKVRVKGSSRSSGRRSSSSSGRSRGSVAQGSSVVSQLPACLPSIHVSSSPLPVLAEEALARVRADAGSLMLVLCLTMASAVLTASYVVYLVR